MITAHEFRRPLMLLLLRLLGLVLLLGPVGHHQASAFPVHVTENALSPDLLAKFIDEGVAVSEWATSGDTLLQGKRPTAWMAADDEPKLFIEEAVRELASLVREQHPWANITGYEWWVQRVEDHETPSFHYDKDESRSSIKREFVFPSVSTIFYVNEVGAPTLIFNRTVSDGHTRWPSVLGDGYLSYPQTNKYVMFNGTWAHGVLPGSFLPAGGYDGHRITLLVNFWEEMPEPPNTVRLPHASLRVPTRTPEEIRRALGRDVDRRAPFPPHRERRTGAPIAVVDFNDDGGEGDAGPARGACPMSKVSDGGSFVNLFHFGVRLPDDDRYMTTTADSGSGPTAEQEPKTTTLQLKWTQGRDIVANQPYVDSYILRDGPDGLPASETLNDGGVLTLDQLTRFGGPMDTVAVVVVPSTHTDSATMRSRWEAAAKALKVRDYGTVRIAFLDGSVAETQDSSAARTLRRLNKAVEDDEQLPPGKPGVFLVRGWRPGLRYVKGDSAGGSKRRKGNEEDRNFFAAADDGDDDTSGGDGGGRKDGGEDGADLVERYSGPAYQTEGIVRYLRAVAPSRPVVKVRSAAHLRALLKMHPVVVHLFLDGGAAAFKKTRRRFGRVAEASGMRGEVLFTLSEDPRVAPDATDGELPLAGQSPLVVAFRDHGRAPLDIMEHLGGAKKAISAKKVLELAEVAVSAQRWSSPAELDLLDRQMLNRVFKSNEPKIFIMADKETRKAHPVLAAASAVMRDYTPQAAAIRGGGPLALFYMVDPASQGDMVSVFRVSGASREGAIMIHDTVKERKHTLRGLPTEPVLRRMLTLFFEGKLAFNPNDFEVTEMTHPAITGDAVDGASAAAAVAASSRGGGVAAAAAAVAAAGGGAAGRAGGGADPGMAQLSKLVARLTSEVAEVRVENERLRNKVERLEGRLAAVEQKTRSTEMQDAAEKERKKEEEEERKKKEL